MISVNSVWLVTVFAVSLPACARSTPAPRPPEAPLDRALGLLAREAPLWPAEHACFSCHHNGDAPRALFAGRRLGRGPSKRAMDVALRSTLEWLSTPERWGEQKGDPNASDTTLARLQFAAAFAGAVEAGILRDEKTRDRACAVAAALQSPDGSWRIEPGSSVGSPATWGTTLATALTRRTLESLGRERFGTAIEKAKAWLLHAPVANVLDTAAIVIGLAGDGDSAAGERIEQCVSALGRARTDTGGWGPYSSAPPEAFDSAVVLLALASLRDRAPVREWIRGGRAFLIATQEEEGGWPATMRPRGGESYAQSTSTTAWAVLALANTEEE